MIWTLRMSMLAVVVFVSPASAIDGVVEINQTRALAGGITASDTAGFPVTLDAAGSYRLTSDLVVTSSVNTNGILILAHDTTLDLNGFAVRCETTAACSAFPGTGSGIIVKAAVAARVTNGSVRDFSFQGVDVDTTQGVQFDRVRVANNGANGIRFDASSSGTIASAILVGNGGDGIEIALGSGAVLIRDSMTRDNAGVGVDAPVVVVSTVGAIHSSFEDGVTGTVDPLGCYRTAADVCP